MLLHHRHQYASPPSSSSIPSTTWKKGASLISQHTLTYMIHTYTHLKHSASQNQIKFHFILISRNTNETQIHHNRIFTQMNPNLSLRNVHADSILLPPILSTPYYSPFIHSSHYLIPFTFTHLKEESSLLNLYSD